MIWDFLGPESSHKDSGKSGRHARRRSDGGESEDLPFELSQVLDALPDAIALIDPEGRIHWVNTGFINLFQAPTAQIKGRLLNVIAGPYANQGEGQAILEQVSVGEGQVDLTAFTKDGMPFPCSIRIRPLGDSTDALRVATLTDNGDLQRLRAELVLKAESALKEREILRATTESLEDVVLVADDAERLVLANNAARTLLGLGGGESHGRPLTELPLPSPIRGAWLTFLASGRPNAVQTARVPIGDAPRTFLLRLARAWSSRGAPLASMLVLRDLSRFTETDRRKYDFISQVSHELRTPLASIQGFVATMIAEPQLEEELRNEFLEIVHQESQRLGSLVENLLEVAQFDGGRLTLDRQNIDLGGILRELRDTFSRDPRLAGAPVSIDQPAEPQIAWIDPERVKRALAQLIENSIQHGLSEKGVRIELRPEGDRLRCMVRDWGPGVPPEDLEKIFDPFYRAEMANTGPASGSGSGLGLALCRQVFERHGGSLRAELPSGGGLRLIAELPLG